MQPNSFIRSDMDTKLAKTEANTPSSFRSNGEKKALKRAKEARRAFRESKGYDVDTFWTRCFKSIFQNKRD